MTIAPVCILYLPSNLRERTTAQKAANRLESLWKVTDKTYIIYDINVWNNEDFNEK